MMVMLDRGDYWQCAFVIPKGGIEEVKAKGLDAFRALGRGDVALSCRPRRRTEKLGRHQAADGHRRPLADNGGGPGLICIGDSAHAMSPIGGVGINVAVQDAVAAANRLAAPLKAGTVTDDDLARHPGTAHAVGALHAVAPADDSEAGRHPRAWQASSGRSRRCCSSCSGCFRCCAAFRRACSGSASAQSTCARRRRGRQLSCVSAVRSRRGRGFRRAALRPRRHCPDAC